MRLSRKGLAAIALVVLVAGLLGCFRAHLAGLLGTLREELPGLLEDLPGHLGGHMLLSMAALGVGIVVSLPLGVLVSRRPPLAESVLGVAGVLQTIPSLALLALMVPLLGGLRRHDLVQRPAHPQEHVSKSRLSPSADPRRPPAAVSSDRVIRRVGTA
jgi:ABC-type proline/glycine betaine transport system permease subunit